MNIAISILSIYAFILIGYMAKRVLKEEIQEKGIVLLSIYFLQPMLSFWGLSTKPITTSLLQIPLLYLSLTLVFMLISYLVARTFFKDPKDKSIVTISVLVGNTGNLGIPLGIALFGQESVIYTTMINVANIFIIYTLGVFLYSRGNSSIKESFLNIFKLPVIWFASLALLLNAQGIEIHPAISKSMEMGGYCGMIMQLIIFGMYLSNVKLNNINLKLFLHVGLLKFIFTPIIAIGALMALPLPNIVAGILILELIVPLAVTNVNLSSIYDCKPLDVTALVFFTSILFIPFFIFISYLLKYLNIVVM